MKTAAKILICGLCMMAVTACGVRDGSAPESERSIAPGDEAAQTPESRIGQYAGTYRYDYEYDTGEQNEDHYIVLGDLNGELAGWYYGTSDDFDEAREGYAPGYYVTDMRDMMIRDGAISFRIELDDGEVFQKPVDLRYRSSVDVRLDDNPLWENELRERENTFSGAITGTEIRLETGTGERVFTKID